MARGTRNRTSSPTVIGYVRVSTTEQAGSGLGLAAQRATIEAEAAGKGWTVATIYEDAGASGKSLTGRPALAEALDQLDRGEAGALIVAKLDRLSRSVHDAAGLLDRAGRNGWGLIAADLGVDTTTPSGEAMANVMATFAQLERRLIGERTKAALAAKKAPGAKLGRPATLPTAIVGRIMTEHRNGAGWSAIARGLNTDNVPTAQGGKQWYPATVRYVHDANT